MKYDFVCESCDHVQEKDYNFDQFKEVKEDGISCTECDDTANYQFNPSGLGVCFKGFAWADKNFKEKAYRKDRSKYMDKRQREVNYVPKLAPNYKGERTKDWKEAKKEAQSDGKFSETYDHLIEKEEQGK